MAERKMILRDSHLWNGERYGPSVDGQPVTVPEDFPKVLKGLDAPEHAKSGGNPLDVNSGGPPAAMRSSDTESDPRSIALGERTSLDGEEIPAGVTGDNLNHATTGLHTVSHPEQPPAGVDWTPVGGTRSSAPTGAGLPDSSPASVATAATTGIPDDSKGTRKGTAPRGATGLSKEALEDMTVEELRDLAKEREVTVTRSEGEGEPLKADFVKALSKR